MSKNTCWKGWSEYGLFITNSEISILKTGLEGLLRKLRSENKWIPNGCLDTNGTFTKKFWSRFVEQGEPIELPTGDLQLDHIGEKNTNGAKFIPSFEHGYVEHHQVYGYVVILEHSPTLCTAAYTTKEDALNEIKSKIEPCLPEDFPWKERFGRFVFAFRHKKAPKGLYAAKVKIQGQTRTSLILIFARNIFEAKEKYMECVHRHPSHIPLKDPEIALTVDFSCFLNEEEIKQEIETYDSATMWQD